MRHICACALWLMSCLATLGSDLDSLVNRLQLFGTVIPQEKVYVHMDNTSYFLGDTIWYAAYTYRTDKQLPSNVSRVLYVELLNQDGFLVERQLVEMRGGRGHGNFVLNDTLYGGFYELRAYTRWQLNWGITEKAHTPYAEEWFYNKTMAKEFYRDYDKLYSRVFPVYDKPQTAGEFFHDMTTRPMRRYFKDGAQEPSLQLSLFPEGGNLVAGVPCCIAFEAATEAGEACEGNVTLTVNHEKQKVKNEQGEDVESVTTENRGRGSFMLTPETGKTYTLTFIAADGRSATATLPAATADGVALHVTRQNEEFVISVQTQGILSDRPLGLTIMHEGRVVLSKQMENGQWTMDNDYSASPKSNQQGIVHCPLSIAHSDLPIGVNQITVFDADGRVWADRLFFVSNASLLQPAISVEGLKKEYAPCEEVNLGIVCPQAPSTHISLAVRDARTQDYTYDNGTILTEMLLSSEIKGFVPDPAYFFEADDDVHRRALDLLMLTQGWRRFDWRTMALPKAFELTQPAESQTPMLRGQVMRYTEGFWQDDVRSFTDTLTPFQMEKAIVNMRDDLDSARAYRKGLQEPTEDGLSTEDEYIGVGQGEVIATIIAETYARESSRSAGSYQMRSTIATSRFASSDPLNKEVRVHAEFVQPGSTPVIGDVETLNGRFTIPSPHFYEGCLFYLSASDTTKWKADKPHDWIAMDEQAAAEYYVRIEPFYPRFTQPYHYAQTHYRNAPEDLPQTSLFNPKTFETDMQGFTVRARRGGLRRFNSSKPAYVLDAYTAFNEACDAGLMTGRFGGRIHFVNSVARCYLGDMNTTNSYLLEPRYDGRDLSFSFTAKQVDRYNMLTNLDSVRIHTDYTPRNGGDPRVTEDNVERVTINLQQIPDEGQRTVYRDRRYVLQGFNVADDFYHPNYRQRPLPAGQKDYRRTLYWNPDLPLNESGYALVTFYNNSQPTRLSVEANGQTADGKFLSTPTNP